MCLCFAVLVTLGKEDNNGMRRREMNEGGDNKVEARRRGEVVGCCRRAMGEFSVLFFV